MSDETPPSGSAGPDEPQAPGGARTLAQLERDHIVATLERLQWRIEGPGGAAAVLGINASTLRSLERLGDLTGDRRGFVCRHCAAGDAYREVVAIDQLHHQRACRCGCTGRRGGSCSLSPHSTGPARGGRFSSTRRG